MPKKKAADATDDPNALKRVRAGIYRSADDRFEVQEAGTGWFIVDSTQADELGQQILQGPYATLAAVREALPDARRTTVRSLPQPRRKAAAEPAAPSEPPPEPEPEPDHPLLGVLLEAAAGRFPPADGTFEVTSSPPGLADAVVAFTARSIIAADVDPATVRAKVRSTDPGAPMSPAFLTWLGKRLDSEPGDVDVVLAGQPGWAPPKALRLTPVEDSADHERVARAMRHRTDVRVFTDPTARGIVTLGRGLADRLEVSIEVDPAHRGRGVGADLARAALVLVETGEPLFAQVSPGNVASVRAFLAAGYRPIGSEALFLRDR